MIRQSSGGNLPTFKFDSYYLYLLKHRIDEQKQQRNQVFVLRGR